MPVLFETGMGDCDLFSLPLRETGRFSLASFIKSAGERALVKRLLLEKNAQPETQGYGLFLCACGRLSNRYHYRLKHDDGVHEPVHKCSKCRATLRLVGLRLEDLKMDRDYFLEIPCPKCGKTSLAVWGTMMWD